MNARNKIAIIGAGAAGLACAISAANQGAEIYLVEQMPNLGGTVSHSLIHTIGGLYDDAGEYINPGLPIELAESLIRADSHSCRRQMGKLWTLSVDPKTYESVINKWITSLPNITVLRSARPGQIHIEGSRVVAIDLIRAGTTRRLQVDTLVDTTGSANVIRFIDPHKVVDGDALAGLIFQIRGVETDALKFPRNIGLQRKVQKAVSANELSTSFARTWFDIGVYDDEIYAKLNILATDFQAAMVPTLKSQLARFLQPIPAFSTAKITRVGHLGIRDGGRIVGEYCLTAGRSLEILSKCKIDGSIVTAVMVAPST